MQHNDVARSRLLLVFMATVLLTGCATQAQQTRQRMDGQIQQAFLQGENCYGKIFTPEIDRRIEDKVILDIEGYDFRLLTVSTYASKQDIEDLLQKRSLAQPCNKLVIEGVGKVHFSYVTIFSELLTQQDKALLDLIDKKTTYALYNRTSVDNNRQALERLANATKLINDDLLASHQYELDQRQAAIRALADWTYQQQLLDAYRQPTAPRISHTNCSIIGSFVSCRTF